MAMISLELVYLSIYSYSLVNYKEIVNHFTIVSKIFQTLTFMSFLIICLILSCRDPRDDSKVSSLLQEFGIKAIIVNVVAEFTFMFISVINLLYRFVIQKMRGEKIVVSFKEHLIYKTEFDKI